MVVARHNLDHKVRDNRQRDFFEVDAAKTVVADKGYVRPADSFACKLKIHLAYNPAKIAASYKNLKRCVEIFADNVVK